MNEILKGVGADAPIVENKNGGKQSKTNMALHLIDPKFLYSTFSDIMTSLEYRDDEDGSTVVDEVEIYDLCRAGRWIAMFMKGTKDALDFAMQEIEPESMKLLVKIGEVLQYGVGRYEPNNWRLIPQEEHINHALIHLVAAIMGDTQDNHKDHCLTRLMMAQATETSPNFSYTKYVKKNNELEEACVKQLKLDLGLEGIGKIGA